MLEGIKHKVYRIAERHHEAGHIGICDCQRLSLVNPVTEQRNDRATGGHDISVSGQAQDNKCQKDSSLFLHQSLKYKSLVYILSMTSSSSLL